MTFESIFKTEEETSHSDRLVAAIDKHVGSKIKVRRCLLGLTQEYVADFLNVSFQQIQKYEKGVNRIGAGRLWRIANVLNVPVSYFYEDINSSFTANVLAGAPCLCDSEQETVQFDTTPRVNRSSVELLRAFSKIKDPAVSKSILELVKSCAAKYGDEDDPDFMIEDLSN